MATREKADAVIVGAGAAGAVFAAVLSRAGKHVVVLEQGPDWQLSDLISSDIWARRLRGSGPAIVYEGRDPVGRTADHGWGTGGAALHYSANFPRLLPSDFNMKSEHGRGLDWPISYTDVAPYYDRVAREIGVSGDAKAEERWRPAGAPYPMPRSRPFAMAKSGFRASSRSASRLRRVRSASTARNTRAGPPVSTTAGAARVVPPAHSPIRKPLILARRAPRARKCGP